MSDGMSASELRKQAGIQSNTQDFSTKHNAEGASAIVAAVGIAAVLIVVVGFYMFTKMSSGGHDELWDV